MIGTLLQLDSFLLTKKIIGHIKLRRLNHVVRISTLKLLHGLYFLKPNRLSQKFLLLIYIIYIDFQETIPLHGINYNALKSEPKDFSCEFNTFVHKVQKVIDTYNRAKKLLIECKDDRANSLHVKFDNEYRNFIQKNFSE